MTSYRPQHIYTVLALVSTVIAALFAWDLIQGVEAGSVLFFAVSLGLLAWSVRAALTRVSLTPDQLIVKGPLSRTRQVDYGQIVSVTEEGRTGKSIVVVYHPRSAEGLVDLDRAQTVDLPAVQNQDALYALLVERAPA